MLQILRCEFIKIWKKPSFLTCVIAMLAANILLLWYTGSPSVSDFDYQAVTQEEYGQFLSDVQKKADSLSEISIFSDIGEETYEQKSIRKTAAQYQKLSDVVILPGQSKGVLSSTDAASTDCILLVLLLIFSVMLIFDEKNKGLFPLICSMPKGRKETALSKIVMLIYTSGCFTFLFWGSNLLYYFVSIGLGDCSRGIQSLAPFIGCPYSVSIAGYLFVFFLTKWFSYLIFSISVLLISIFFSRISTIGLVTTVVFGIEACLYAKIEPLSPYRLFRIFNVFNLLSTNNFYSTYSTVNIFGGAISAILMTWIILLLVTLLFSFLIILVFSEKKNSINGISLFQQIQKKFSRIHITPAVSVWKQEAYKLFVINKGIIFLLVFVVLVFPKITQENIYLSSDELYYKTYMEHLSGKLTEEKEGYLNKEKQRLTEAQIEISRIEALYKEKKITEIQRVQYEQPYQSAILAENAFSRVMQYYNNVKQHDDRAFLYDSGYIALFEGNGAVYLAILIFCSLCFSNLFSMELQNKVNLLIRTLPKGRENTVRCKAVLSLIVAAFITCIAFGMELFSAYEAYGLNQWDAPISSIPIFSSLPDWLPIWGYIVMQFCFELFSVLSSTLIILAISVKHRNGLISMLLSVFLLVVPIVLYFMGMQVMQYVSFLPLILSGSMLMTKSGIIICVIYCIVAALSASIIFLYLKKRFGRFV